MSQKIPVFLHIPKNAGTYVLSWTMNLFRRHGVGKGWDISPKWELKLRRLLVQHEANTIMTIFVYDSNEICKNNKEFVPHEVDAHVNTISLYPFLDELLNNKLEVFSIIIESAGFYSFKTSLCNLIFKIIDKQPVYYTILREVFSRTVSLYNYITSEASFHEPSHKGIKSNTFEDYINSCELADSWLIRSLINIPDSKELNEDDFNAACILLDQFKISDISQVDQTIDELFYECYSIKRSDALIDSPEVNKNKQKIKTRILFHELIDQSKQRFLERTFFDKKIYDRYCK